jgi:predicted nucleic acid-binding protein
VIIADTNVVSESMKDSPDRTVLAWAQGIGPAELAISVVTVEEIDRGLGRTPKGRRRRDLERRWGQLLDDFVDAIAEYDLPAARQTAAILVAAEAYGRQMSLADAQIAGICLAGGYQLATRNVTGLSSTTDLAIINPFA